MIFNPLRFDSSNTGKNYSSLFSYLTPEQFCLDRNANHGNFNLLNVNIRSLSKNFDSLKACIKKTNKEFSVIGISETHLKDKPNDYLNIP